MKNTFSFIANEVIKVVVAGIELHQLEKFKFCSILSMRIIPQGDQSQQPQGGGS
jgi:hypothetical protein